MNNDYISMIINKIKDINFIEILIIFILIYGAIFFLRRTRAVYIVSGILVSLIALKALSNILKLEVLSELFTQLGSIYAIALVVIFQPELRKALAFIGTPRFIRTRNKQKNFIAEITHAAIQLANQKFGAIIVIEKNEQILPLTSDSVVVNAEVSSAILESIFYPKSRLHDGAVIITEGEIIAAHAVLPFPDSNVHTRWGTRHRAALGISEESDAVILVVSEETGAISLAYKGVLNHNIDHDHLFSKINRLVALSPNAPNPLEVTESAIPEKEISNEK